MFFQIDQDDKNGLTPTEVSTAFPFRVNWRHETERLPDGQMDGMQRLMQPPREAA